MVLFLEFLGAESSLDVCETLQKLVIVVISVEDWCTLLEHLLLGDGYSFHLLLSFMYLFLFVFVFSKRLANFSH